MANWQFSLRGVATTSRTRVVSLHEDGWYLPLPKVNYFAPWRRGLCVTRWCCTWGHRATSTRSWPPAPSPSPRTSTRVDRSRHHGQRRRLPNPDERVDVRVDLLRADPQVFGLSEPLTPTLRRRGIEMLAYLALHRYEPVTGDRLRTRVLTHADVDASLRTLANTASVVRRSAGADAAGPRLHAVTSSGLYVTHGITSDVEDLQHPRRASSPTRER